MTYLLPRIGWGALVAASFLVPVAFTHELADPYSLPKATIWWIAAILAATGVAADAIGRRAWPVPRIRVTIPIAVLIVWTLLATVVSGQPLVSVMGQYGRYDGLVELIGGVVVALAIVAFAGRSPDRLAAIAWAVVAGAALSLLVVVAQGLGLDWPVGTGAAVEAIPGLAGNSNFSGAMLALAVPFVLGVRAEVSGRAARIGLAVGAVALGAGVVWTGTRGGLLCLLAGVAAFGLLAPALLPKALRIGAVAAFVVGLSLIGLLSLGGPRSGSGPEGVQRLFEGAGLAQRQNVWSGSAEAVRGAPLFGVGPDVLGLEFPYDRASRPDGLPLIFADEAHNVFLDRAATAGLPAVAAYLWLVGTVVVGAWRARKAVAAEHRWLLAAFGGAFAGYLAQGAFSIDMVPLAFAAWSCIGALVVLTDPAVAARRDEAEPEVRPVPVLPLVGLTVVAVAAVGLALRPALADRHARRGLDAAAAGHHLEAYGQYATASSWLGHESRYLQREASSLVAAASAPGVDPELRRTLLAEASIAYDHALEQAPGDVRILRAQADTHLLAAQAAADADAAAVEVDAAIESYRRLMASVRATDDLHLGYGRALEARMRLGSDAAAARDRELAARQFRAARDYLPTRVAGYEGSARLAIDEGDLSKARHLLVEAKAVSADDTDLDAAIEELDRRIDAGE